MIFWWLGKIQFNVQGVTYNLVPMIENIHVIHERANESDQN